MKINVDDLKRIPLLTPLSDKALQKIAQTLEEGFYPAGQFLFHENERGNKLISSRPAEWKLYEVLTLLMSLSLPSLAPVS